MESLAKKVFGLTSRGAAGYIPHHRARHLLGEKQSGSGSEGCMTMGGRTASIIYVVAMVAVIVALDVAIFRVRFWERLMANVGIVLVFAAFYLRFLKHPQ
jgi:hypothetical protein